MKMLISQEQDKISILQLKLPLDIGVKIDKDDPVVTFKEVIEGVNLRKFLNRSSSDPRGRDGYDPEVLLKIVLFAYMINVRSTRKIEALCRNDIRFMYLSDEITPSHMTISNFINQYLLGNIEDIFSEITAYIIAKQNIDISTVFIDGTKIEAMPNKYTWVWKRACTTSRDRKFRELKQWFAEINNDILWLQQPVFPVQDTYSIEDLEELLEKIRTAMTENDIVAVSGRGKRKTKLQRTFDRLNKIVSKLKEYADKIEICGEGRNSYSKTDQDATFMRMKTDYMGNTALLPAYNWQLMTAGEVIVAGLTSQSASDGKCLIPLIEKYKEVYGEYPKKAVGDAGYGNLDTYKYCEKNGIEAHLKFASWKRETHDKKFHNDPFRSRNFKTDEDGDLVCPGGKKFLKKHDKVIKGNKDQRTEEVYQCESCEGCPLREKCHKGTSDRIININRTLTTYHEQVIERLATEEGIQLRMTRTAMAEGTFGVIKSDYKFNRLTRISLTKVNMEFYLIMIGFNLAKYHNLKHRKDTPQLS